MNFVVEFPFDNDNDDNDDGGGGDDDDDDAIRSIVTGCSIMSQLFSA